VRTIRGQCEIYYSTDQTLPAIPYFCIADCCAVKLNAERESLVWSLYGLVSVENGLEEGLIDNSGGKFGSSIGQSI
jgi:hypothetical protein